MSSIRRSMARQMAAMYNEERRRGTRSIPPWTLKKGLTKAQAKKARPQREAVKAAARAKVAAMIKVNRRAKDVRSLKATAKIEELFTQMANDPGYQAMAKKITEDFIGSETPLGDLYQTK